MHTHHKVADVRSWFQDLQTQGQYVTDKTGCKMIEVIGATFEADEEAIFGKVNRDYVNREIEWYKSMSLSINDIPGGAPTGWKACASKGGLINSNYGYLIWSKENGQQYNKVLAELVANPESRRATMVYTRPTIPCATRSWTLDGRSRPFRSPRVLTSSSTCRTATRCMTSSPSTRCS
jgi:thymidylate synthase